MKVARYWGAALLLGSLWMASCSKEQSTQAKNSGVAPLPAKEIDRGRTACKNYVARVCACAKTHPELSEECSLSGARPGAFELNLELGDVPGLSVPEAQAVKVEARKIAAACFEADSKLDPTKCPRL